MNNAVFAKNMENARKHRDMELVTIEARRNYLVPESNYHAKKKNYGNFVSHRNEKTQIFMNTPVYLAVPI